MAPLAIVRSLTRCAAMFARDAVRDGGGAHAEAGGDALHDAYAAGLPRWAVVAFIVPVWHGANGLYGACDRVLRHRHGPLTLRGWHEQTALAVEFATDACYD